MRRPLETFTRMKMITSLGAMAALVIASAEAKMTCHPSGVPSKLVYRSRVAISLTEPGPDYEAMFLKGTVDDKAYLRIGHGLSFENFQFYECSEVPEGFTGSRETVRCGQVRSTKSPDLCLSIQKIDYGVMKGEENALDERNVFMTMEKCDEEDPRLQWWETSNWNLFFMGKEGEGDQGLRCVEIAEEGKLYMYKFNWNVFDTQLGSNRPTLAMVESK